MPFFALEIFIVTILGLCFGSFATAISYRELNNLSWAFQDKEGQAEQGISSKRSVCPHCKHVLGVWDLIPILSWLSTKGCCRYCNEPIGISYPLIELTSLIACLGIYLALGLSLAALPIYLLVPFLIALGNIDLKAYILPNLLVLIVSVLGLLSLSLNYLLGHIEFDVVIMHGSAMMLYSVVVFLIGKITSKILKKETLGFGDVKFFASAGLWLGPWLFADFLILSGIYGVATALIWRFVSKDTIFPFGPGLILSLYTLLLIDGSILLNFPVE